MRFHAATVFLLASAVPSCQAFSGGSGGGNGGGFACRNKAPHAAAGFGFYFAAHSSSSSSSMWGGTNHSMPSDVLQHQNTINGVNSVNNWGSSRSLQPQSQPPQKKSQQSTQSQSQMSQSMTVQPQKLSPLQQQQQQPSQTSPSSKYSRAARERASASARDTRANAVEYLNQYVGQSGAAAVYSKLVEYGVQVVNGFSGGAVLPLLDQFHPDNPRHRHPSEAIRWITNSNEASAGHIAEGYAKSIPIDPENLPVGVAVATSGPGVTNLITPLQDAICDGVPMVVLCGQAATVAPKDAFQSSPAVELTRPCTKWSYQIKNAAEVPFALDYAFYMARNGRPGPVFIDLPKDLQNQIITDELITAVVDNNLAVDENGSGNDEPGNVARLVKRYRTDGSVFQAIQLGTGGKGLAFEIQRDASQFDGTTTLKLHAVPSAEPMDLHHADHHPSNYIYRTSPQSTLPGSGTTVIKEGVLQMGSSLTNEMLKLIQRAKKPVIIAGQGCNDCPQELKEFAERLQIPVTTTLHGMGCFDERNNLALNMMGMHGHATPNFMVQEADLIMCIGSRFDDRITGRMSDFASEAKTAQREERGGIIHVDIRLTENAKQVEPTYFVHSTGKNFLQTLNRALRTASIAKPIRPVTGAWLTRMKDLQRNYPIRIPKFPTQLISIDEPATGVQQFSPRTPMSAQRVVDELNQQLVSSGKIDEAIFTTGVGVHQMIAAQFITWTQPRQMLSSGSLGTMGVALGYAIGAKLANDGKIVISIDGDGSFNMTFTELKTLVEQGIPIKILILDNDGQMMVEYWQRLFHDNRLLAVRNSHNPDYVKLAGAFGIKAMYADHEEELSTQIHEFLYADPDQPVLFHARVKRTPCLPMVAPGQPLQNMIHEDLSVDTDGMDAPS